MEMGAIRFVKSGLLDWVQEPTLQFHVGAHGQALDFRYYHGSWLGA